MQSSPNGLGQADAAARLQQYGRNTLPASEPPGIVRVFLHQFASPLIYVLAAAALVSLLIQEWSDAGFICAVLLLNAIIGTAQEYSAQRAVLPSRADLDAEDFVVMNDGMRRIAIADANELDPVTLSAEQFRDLIDFLHALTDRDALDLRSDTPSGVPSGLPLAE